MSIASPLTLLIAAVLASPSLWSAFVEHDLDVADAAGRYLIAVVVAAFMLWLLRSLVEGYHRTHPQRRTTDTE